jgi:hypothetical protein
MRALQAVHVVHVVHVASARGSLQRRLAVERAAAAVDVRNEFAAPLLEVAVDRVDGELAERAQTLPRMLSPTFSSRSRSARVAVPASIDSRICTIQRVPTRHGVHLPHDSCI